MPDESSRLDLKLNAADVEALYRVMLLRDVGDAERVRGLVEGGATLRGLLTELRRSRELTHQIRSGHSHAAWDAATFRAPNQLRAAAPAPWGRVLMVGSCLMEGWAHHLEHRQPPTPCDLFLNAAPLPNDPPHPAAEYPFMLVQVALRSVLPDLALARLAQADTAGHQALFAQCVERLRHWLHRALQWNRTHGVLAFVFPFLLPQQNLVGRLMRQYDLANPVHFIDRLNAEMEAILAEHTGAYLVDLNGIMGTLGRRGTQEDMIAQINHGNFLYDCDTVFDGDTRIEPAQPASIIYGTHLPPVFQAGWNEILAMHRSATQVDAVKLVVLDLDDTLWRGVAAEYPPGAPPSVEGWPKGLWEALAILRRRGVLLGIISNNDDDRIVELFPQVLDGGLTLDDFAIRRIDWRPKPERMAEILAATGLLADNVLFIDDNPVQRADMRAAYPAMRVLGGTPAVWRHILLWAPETQTATITAEAGARTAMVQAQGQREAARTAVPRSRFLAELNLRMTLAQVTPAEPARFDRVLELINKTNQFNTTGQRWTRAELLGALQDNTRIFAFELEDRFTRYGLVGVLLVQPGLIRQFVMSCRVMGLEAEVAAVAAMLARTKAQGIAILSAALVHTDRNLPCRTLYERCGFTPTPDGWQHDTAIRLKPPSHIAMVRPG